MADLPSGTVTFLFTDIEGSTALWERDPSAMRIAVDRHFALLQDATTTHGGVLFKTVGDAVHAAFGSAAGAAPGSIHHSDQPVRQPGVRAAPARGGAAGLDGQLRRLLRQRPRGELLRDA